MKNKNKLIAGIAITGAALFSGITYAVGKMVYKASVGSSPSIDKDNMIDHYANREDKILDKLGRYDNEKLFIESPRNGYDIEVVNIKSNINTKDVIVLVHGIESNYHEVLNVAFNYLENGYNVVVYNQRQTGYTGGTEYTFGVYERLDLEEVVNYAAKNYPEGILGVHGFSMGAATATMHTEINEEKKNVDFYILDAPYHTMKSAVNLGIERKNIPLIPLRYVSWAGELYIKRKAGFRYKDSEPYRAVKGISVPVMLIHGTGDKVTSPEGSKIIYDTIPHNNKELWLIDDLGHCVASNLIEKEYFSRIYKFIEENIR